MNSTHEPDVIHVGEDALRVVRLERVLGPEAAARLPLVMRVLAENVARTSPEPERGPALDAIVAWLDSGSSTAEISVLPGRLLMHDTTATPALVDIAALRDAVDRAGGRAGLLNPGIPVQVSVDHSLAVDAFGVSDAASRNLRTEMRRNAERYAFLKWAGAAMDTLTVNPPGTGIMHTINLEQLATVVRTEARDDGRWAVPDLMIGTDSHTPMVNGLGVLGWGVGGLEAQTVMFGMPLSLRIPEVVGVRLTGTLPPGVLATDLALTVTHRLRSVGVTGQFVEFFGPGVSALTVGDRAVVANMAPEYGATTGFFGVDDQTLRYLRETGRPGTHVQLVETWARATGMWLDPQAHPTYTRVIEVDLRAVATSAAGPRRPQDLLPVGSIPAALDEAAPQARPSQGLPSRPVALAAITSCTNTSDPALLITAGLVARRAREYGLQVPPWVKTSLAPGSPAARRYLDRSGLAQDLHALGFDIVGFGCTTCIGNSGELTQPIVAAAADGATPVAILSGNRNFPGRVHPDLELGFLMSPPMVVAYAIAGDAALDLTRQPVATLRDGQAIHLADLWPSSQQVQEALRIALDPDDVPSAFEAARRNTLWDELPVPEGDLFAWDPRSSTLRPPPFADPGQGSLLGTYVAHPLLVLGDDVTTDHISPASAIPRSSDVADFLVERGEDRRDLGVYAARRGNWEVMVRGAFQNRSLINALAPDAPMGHTVHAPSGELLSVWDAAERYRTQGQPVVIVAGDRYGMGSSRDWAAKAQRLLGVRAVLAVGYERIHRSNLVGMGVLPLVIPAEHRGLLSSLRPGDTIEVLAEPDTLRPHGGIEVTVRCHDTTGRAACTTFTAQAAVETSFEVDLLRAGGVIPTILHRTLAAG